MAETTVPRSAQGSKPAPRRKSTLLFLRDLLIIFLIAVLASVLIKAFLVRSFYIPSRSMEATLMINDRILVNELQPRFFPIEHGDVVVFRDPGGWLPPRAEPNKNPIRAGLDWLLDAVGLAASDSNDHLIKRVIGMPGDHVVCCNALGQMTVNGVPLEETYVQLPPGETAVSAIPFDVVVPDGSLWVMGDNRYNSADSRYNENTPGGGFVPIDNVVGRALVITWPIGRWAWLDNYGQVFQGVEDAAGKAVG